MYTVKDLTTGRVIQCTKTELDMLGKNYVVIQEPKTQPKAEPKAKKTEVKPEKEYTREEYIAMLKEMDLGLKGLHLYSLEKLKKTYEDQR